MSFHDFSGPSSTSTSPTNTTGSGGSSSAATTGTSGGGGNGGSSGSSGQGPSVTPVPEELISYNEKYANATPLLYRDDVIKAAVTVLISKNKPNPALTGLPGVGKSSVVGEIARRIVAADPTIPRQLKNTTVYELRINDLMSGTAYRGQLEEKIKAIIAFASKMDCIIFIDEMHTVMSRRSADEGMADALKPALADGTFRCIGATTSNEWNQITADPAMARRFTPVIVDEPTPTQTAGILRHVLPSYLDHYTTGDIIATPQTLDDALIEDIITVADAELPGHRPDKTLTLLDRSFAASTVALSKRLNKGTVIGPTPLTVSRTRIDTTAASLTGRGAASKASLTGPRLRTALTDALATVRHQDHVVDTAVTRVSRFNRGLFTGHRPEVWMFAGPSGVGKTEIASRIADTVGDDPMIRLNMSEYRSSTSTANLIGAGKGLVGYSDAAEMPFDPVKTNPRQYILLDEIEKAHPAVWQLFLQVFDTGELRMTDGTVLDFSHCVIIMTTNAAKSLCSGKNHPGFSVAPVSTTSNGPDGPVEHKALLKELSTVFTTEFLGRITWITAFNPITEDVYRDIITDLYAEHRTRIIARRPDYTDLLPETVPTDDLDRLTATFVPDSGARPALPAVAGYIEDTLDAAGV